MVHHSAERLLELLVECAGAINNEVSQAVAGIPPSDYYSSFFSMVSAGWLSQELALELAEYARIRNTLCDSISLDEIYKHMQGCLTPWTGYLARVNERLASAGEGGG